MSPVSRFSDSPPQANGDASAEHIERRRRYEDAEARVAQAVEKVVARPSFGLLLAQVSENVIALTKIASDSADLALSNLRIAGRRDVARLERQLGRSEDKLETLLQELESLRDELAESRRRADLTPDGAHTRHPPEP
jgi:predicted ribosome quality control (RQC) complex YloA/Tae2 family protein